MEDAPDRARHGSLTGAGRGRSSARGAHRVKPRAARVTGGVRSRVDSLARGRQRRVEAAPLRRCLRPAQAGHVRDSTEAGGAPSSAPPTGAGSPQGGLAPRRSPGFGREGRAVGRVSALRSEVERSAGTRVERWLQKPVRSILHAPARGAERQTERARASTSRRPPLWRGAKRTRRANGCRISAYAPNRGHVKVHSVARSSIEPAEGVLGLVSRRP